MDSSLFQATLITSKQKKTKLRPSEAKSRRLIVEASFGRVYLRKGKKIKV
jgi:hypothetical protein